MTQDWVLLLIWLLIIKALTSDLFGASCFLSPGVAASPLQRFDTLESSLVTLNLLPLRWVWHWDLPWEYQRSFCRSATVIRTFGLATNILDNKPMEKKYLNNNGRCQQCHVENIFISWDSKTNLDVWASTVRNVSGQHSVTNVHKLALTQRCWLYLLPGRLVCFLLKPVWIFLAALSGLVPRQLCHTSRKRLTKFQQVRLSWGVQIRDCNILIPPPASMAVRTIPQAQISAGWAL